MKLKIQNLELEINLKNILLDALYEANVLRLRYLCNKLKRKKRGLDRELGTILCFIYIYDEKYNDINNDLVKLEYLENPVRISRLLILIPDFIMDINFENNILEIKMRYLIIRKKLSFDEINIIRNEIKKLYFESLKLAHMKLKFEPVIEEENRKRRRRY